MNAAEVEERIAKDRILILTPSDWVSIAEAFDEVERHNTMMAGSLVIIRTAHGLAAVEQPKASERVVRLLGDAETARRFVADRMAQYERMWDGCGCRVDYYG